MHCNEALATQQMGAQSRVMEPTFTHLPLWQSRVLGGRARVAHFAVKAILRPHVAQGPQQHPGAELGPGA